MIPGFLDVVMIWKQVIIFYSLSYQVIRRCSPFRLKWPSNLTMDHFSNWWHHIELRLNNVVSTLPQLPTPIVHWVCPPPRFVKLNVDETTRAWDHRAGIGLVVHSHLGDIFLVKSLPLFSCPSPRVLEALAIREALLAILHGNNQNLVIEGDPQVVYHNSRNGWVHPPQHIAIIVRDCKSLSFSFQSFSFRFVPRTCNGVAAWYCPTCSFHWWCTSLGSLFPILVFIFSSTWYWALRFYFFYSAREGMRE